MAFLKIADIAKGPAEMPQDPPIQYSFPLDPFQQHALKAICNEENVLVTAKTGSGKTLVGEVQIAYSLRKGKRVFYTTPIKSLSNQKFHDLKKQFGEGRVGIMTGDIKFCPDADVVIMTTEILRNLLYKKGSTTEHLGPTANLTCDNLDAVIFDECHYINDKDRGHIWEEVMILLPPEVKLIMLSATLDKPEYFAEWLGDLKQRPINLISTEYRIVPLTHTIWYDEKFHTLMDARNHYDANVYRDWLNWLTKQDKSHVKFQEKVRDARAAGTEGAISGKVHITSFLHRMNLLIRTLEEKQLLPALFFVLSRKGCEKYAQKVEGTLITSSETSAVRHIWNFHLSRNREKLEKLPQYHTLYELVQRGIAFHHSGIIPTLKEIIEILFGKGLIKTLFATETFAVGINMPTKTAIFVDLEKFDEEFNGMRLLKTAEYLQMAGRAGRRGLDTMGTVIYFPDRAPVDPSEMQAMMRGGKAPVTSRMDFGYDFILKTIQSGNRNWLDILEKSYWRRQREEWLSDIKKDIQRKFTRMEQIALSADEEVAMVEKASLEVQIRENTNAKRKKAELALRSWKDVHSGAKWAQAEAQYTEILEIKRQIKVAEKDMDKAMDVSSSVESKIRVLQACGFLKECDNLKTITSESLTSRGILASELNECDSLLVSQFYLLPEAKALDPKDLLCILAACIFEGAKKTDEPHIDELDVSQIVKAGVKTLIELWNCVRDEEDRIGSKPYEWQLSTFWISPINRWINGEPIAQICADNGIYEGNMIRSVLKLNNMLEEWRSMATYCEDAEILEKFRDAESFIIRESVIQDSIYLNL